MGAILRALLGERFICARVGRKAESRDCDRPMMESLEPRTLLAAQIPSNYELVETRTISATSASSQSFATSLWSGTDYYVVASGTAKIGDRTDTSGPRHTDAVMFDDFNETDVFSRQTTAPAGRFDFQGVSDADGGGFAWGDYQADHIYGQLLTATGGTFGIVFQDQGYQDNAGSLQLELYAPAGTHGTTSPDPRLVAHWRLDEAAGNVAGDASDQNHNGTVYGATYQPDDGAKRGALYFDGNDRVEFPTDSIAMTSGKGSVSLWAKLPAASQPLTEHGMLFYGNYDAAGDGYGVEKELHLTVLKDGRISFAIEGNGAGDPGGTDVRIDGPNVNDGQWHHLAATWDKDAGTAKLFVDGELVGTDAHTAWDFALRHVRLGRPMNSTRHYVGWLDDVRVYDEALTDEQISESAGTTGLVAYWKLDGSASDASGHEHHGFVIGNPAWQLGQSVLHLDGDDRVAPQQSTLLNLGITPQRTVALWFKAENLGYGTPRVLYEEGGAHRGMNIFLRDGAVWVGGWNREISESNWEGTFLSAPLGSVVEGQWHHVAVVLDAGATVGSGQIMGYLDGEQFGSGDASQLWPRNDVGIGDRHVGTRFDDNSPAAEDSGSYGFTGQLDDIRVYNDALSQAQIAALMVPVVSITAAPADLHEANATQSMITVTSSLPRRLTVQLQASGTATAGDDYTLPLTVEIYPTSDSAQVQLDPLSDALDEFMEMVDLTVLPSSDYTVAPIDEPPTSVNLPGEEGPFGSAQVRIWDVDFTVDEDEDGLNLRDEMVIYLTDPLDPDTDDDDLVDGFEAELGTDPAYFDSDGDLLPDGWEYQYWDGVPGNAFDPLSPDDPEGDYDEDGLNNLGESVYGSDPTKTDTDGDGVDDDDEANQGSDPTDPGDGGQPPPEDTLVWMDLVVGDDSGSHHERWRLDVGKFRFNAPDFGKVGVGTFPFKRGESYPVDLTFVARNMPEEHYDETSYLALGGTYNNDAILDGTDWIRFNAPHVNTSEVPFFIIDPVQTGEDAHPILNGGYSGPESKAMSARLYFPIVNLTAHGVGDDFGATVPDEVENSGDPSEFVVLTNNDFDRDLSDGLRDFEDDSADPSIDDDLVKIKLHKITGDLPTNLGLMYHLGLSDPGKVRLFKDDGSLLFDGTAPEASLDALEFSLDDPQGYLGDLMSNDVIVWLEAVQYDKDFTLSSVWTNSGGSPLVSDDVHINFVEFNLVGTDGQIIRHPESIWKKSLLAYAETGLADPEDPFPTFFKYEMRGLADPDSITLVTESATVSSDEYEDTLEPAGTDIHRSTRFTTFYSSDVVYGASPDSALSGSEREMLLDELNVQAVHNEDGTVKTRFNHQGAIIRQITSRRVVLAVLSNDGLNGTDAELHPGDQIHVTLTHAEARPHWVWSVTLPNGSVQSGQGVSFSFSFQAPAPGDHVIRYTAAESNLSTVFVDETAAAGSSLIRVLPSGQTMNEWQQLAWKSLRVFGGGGNGGIGSVPGHPINRNRRITELYADIYNGNKSIFKWAGMAAFASNAVGGALAMADEYKSLPGGAGIGFDLLTAGNLAVFDDLAPQLLAYDNDGIDAIRAMANLPLRQLQAWEKIEQGQTTSNSIDIWAGNRDLLQFEQEITLQQIAYDPNLQFWTDLTNTINPLVPNFESPIPGHNQSFQDYRATSATIPANGSLGHYPYRWEWIDNSMLPAWQAWDAANASIDVQKLLDNEY